MKSCKEKAAEWGISSRAVNDMCKKGKVAGAVKENGTWRIPDVVQILLAKVHESYQ